MLADGYAPTGHPQAQAIYQTQGGPPGVVQNQQPSQSNQAQSLANQQNQARLTPMTQPTAPPTPPTQQQQQQSQQAPQYAVQMPQSGLSAGAGNTRAPQYRAQNQVPRRQPQPQQQMNQPFLYHQQVPYGFVLPQIRGPAFGYVQYPQMTFNGYQTAAPNFGQIPAPANGQQRQSTPQTSVPAMAPPQTNEYSGYQAMDVYPSPVMQASTVTAQAPPQPQQKTVKKAGSKALKIVNPLTGKSIFDDDNAAPSGASASSSGSANASNATASVDKAITASHIELNKDEAVEKEVPTTAEPSTPVVSAMSDGPSVDITPKHQVNKMKKL